MFRGTVTFGGVEVTGRIALIPGGYLQVTSDDGQHVVTVHRSLLKADDVLAVEEIAWSPFSEDGQIKNLAAEGFYPVGYLPED